MSRDDEALIESEASSEVPTARRVGGGIEARIAFIGPPNERLFASFSLPTGRARGAVLICSSLHVDFTKNYRNEVLLGWALGQAGFAVLRFHYRGSGHSDGENDEATFGSMREDTAHALDHLRSETGAERVALIGCRLGAIVAAATVAPLAGSPLVLWEPVMAGSDYVREAVRARRLSAVSAGSGAAPSTDASIDVVRESGPVEVHGSALHEEFTESFAGRTLAGELGDNPRPIMLLRASRQEKLPRSLQHVLQGWDDQGFLVEVRRVSNDLPWWFTGSKLGRDRTDLIAREGIAPTVEWVRERLQDEGP
jgi:pimeloyl-ACP methyl ester carboxylesterase